MKGIRYTDEFKSEAVKQITGRGYVMAEVLPSNYTEIKTVSDKLSSFHKSK